jgi:hypothetical protein
LKSRSFDFRAAVLAKKMTELDRPLPLSKMVQWARGCGRACPQGLGALLHEADKINAAFRHDRPHACETAWKNSGPGAPARGLLRRR